VQQDKNTSPTDAKASIVMNVQVNKVSSD